MRGLYIDFEIKRRSKMNKLMDYVIVLTLFIFAFTFIVYKSYLDKNLEYTKQRFESEQAHVSYLNALSEVGTLGKNYTSTEILYNELYEKIEDALIPYDDYIEELYARANNNISIERWNLLNNNTIILDVSFALVDTELFYSFQDDIEGLIWVSEVELEGAVDPENTVMVIQYE